MARHKFNGHFDSTRWGHHGVMRAFCARQSFSSIVSDPVIIHPVQHDPQPKAIEFVPGHEINPPLASLWALDSDFTLNYYVVLSA